MPDVRVQPVEEIHMKDLNRIRRIFLNSKHFCFCLPLGIEAEKDFARDYRKCPDLKNVCGVALLPEKGVVGFCQLLFEGMPCDFHKAKPGEAYVMMLAVDKEARGMGVGSKLMAWAEEVARERNCNYMALEVLHGNPAIGLYERKGYVLKKKPLWKRILSTIPTMLFVSPITCPNGGACYCNYGQLYYMKKPLGS